MDNFSELASWRDGKGITFGVPSTFEPDLKKKAKQTDTAYIYLKALDTIFTAMKGKRIFDRFNLPISIINKRPQAKLLSNFKEWEYNSSLNDWQNIESDEVLSGYSIPPKLDAILTHNLNDSIS